MRACFKLARVCTPMDKPQMYIAYYRRLWTNFSAPRYTLFTGQREREIKREREGEREKERVFIFKRNDGCLGTF